MISNTYFSSDPAINPLNAASYAYARKIGHISKGQFGDASKLQVPNQDIPLYGSDEWHKQQSNQLTVPNQDIPLGDQLNGNGFIPGHNSLFRLSTGAILDFKTRKLLFDPIQRNSQYWDDPNKIISLGYSKEHKSSQREFDMLIAVASSKNGCIDAMTPVNADDQTESQIDPASAQYWLQAEEEAQKMMSSMTDEQKKMIQDFEKHFPKSRLIEECKRGKLLGTIL